MKEGLLMNNKLLKLLLTLTVVFSTMTVFAQSVFAAQTLTISTAISDDPYVRVFTVTNNDSAVKNYTYTVSGDTNESGATVNVGANGSNTHEIHLNKNGGTIYFQLKNNTDGDYSAAVASIAAYRIKVYYQCNGTPLKDMTYVTCNANGASASAPASIPANGRVYNVLDGLNYKEVAYGTEAIVFEYELQARDDYQSKVVFIDQDGNTIKSSETFTVNEANGGYYQVPQTITHNSRTYTLMANQGDISQSYNDGANTYYVRYQIQEESANLPYYVTVDYRAGDVLLARKTLTVQNGKTVSHVAPSTFKAGTASYQLAGNGTITHTYGDAAKNYTVQYTQEVTDQNQPYDVYVQYVDVTTGKILESHYQTVGVDKTVKFDIPGSLNDAGVNYILAPEQPTTITHQFGSAQRQYNVYFHEKDLNIEEYPVTISYYDLTENKILFTTKATANVNDGLTITVPSTYEANGNQYVLLSGQDNEYTHEFYSTRRSYTFIYRNADDLANQDVVVLPGDNGGVVETPTGTTVTIDYTTGRTVITVPENETPLVVNENGELVNEPTDNTPETEVVEENETPLANGKKQDQTSYIIGGSAVGIAAVAGLVFYIVKKRKKEAKEVK